MIIQLLRKFTALPLWGRKLLREISKDEQGTISLPILGVFFTVMVIMIGTGFAYSGLLAAQRSEMQAKINGDTKDAVKLCVSTPLYNLAPPDPQQAQTLIAQYIANKLKAYHGNVVFKGFQIFTDADKGKVAPPGINGIIPGASAYVDISVTCTIPIPMTSQTATVSYPVRALIGLSSYYAPDGTYN